MGANEDYLDKLLNSVMQGSEEPVAVEQKSHAETNQKNNQKTVIAEDDVTALLDTMTDDSDLAEISALLKAANGDSSSEDMLAMLENAGSDLDDNADMSEAESLFDFFANEHDSGTEEFDGSEISELLDKKSKKEKAAEEKERLAAEKARKKREKEEEKARKRQEKQEQLERQKAEKLAAKQAAKAAKEQAAANKNEKSKKSAPAKEEPVTETLAEEDLLAELGMDDLLASFNKSDDDNIAAEDDFLAGFNASDDTAPEIPSELNAGDAPAEASTGDEIPADLGLDDLFAGMEPETEKAAETEAEETLPEPAEEEDKKENKKDKKNKEKKSKEKDPDKKPGFLGRLFGGLLEEADEEVEEAQEIALSDENREILEEMSGEKIKNKNKKKKDKKAKNAKGKGEQEGDEEGAEEGAKGGKKGKPKKEKKPKPVKEKKEKAPEPQGKKLPRKKITSIFLICFTLMGIIVICSYIVPAYWDLKNARKAYYDGDYETVYSLLNNGNLNESDTKLYRRSVMVLYLKNKLDSYYLNTRLGQDVQAINDLFDAVDFYLRNEDRAEDASVLSDMRESYLEVIAILQSKYDVSENRAGEIVRMDSVEYNRELYFLLFGEPFTVPGLSQTEDGQWIYDASLSGSGTNDGSMSDNMTGTEQNAGIPSVGGASNEDRVTSGESWNGGTQADVENTEAGGEGAENQEGSAGENAPDGENPNGDETVEPSADGGDDNLIYSGVVENGSVFMQ